MKSRNTEKCLLCGNTTSSIYDDDDYLNGFCDTCVMSMKNEKKRKLGHESPYNDIIRQITIQIEKIETVVSSIVDKSSPKPSQTSSSTAIPDSSSKSKPKKEYTSKLASDSTIDEPYAPYKKTDDKNSKKLRSESVPPATTNKTKKIKKSKFTPTVSPIED